MQIIAPRPGIRVDAIADAQATLLLLDASLRRSALFAFASSFARRGAAKASYRRLLDEFDAASPTGSACWAMRLLHGLRSARQLRHDIARASRLWTGPPGCAHGRTTGGRLVWCSVRPTNWPKPFRELQSPLRLMATAITQPRSTKRKIVTFRRRSEWRRRTRAFSCQSGGSWPVGIGFTCGATWISLPTASALPGWVDATTSLHRSCGSPGDWPVGDIVDYCISLPTLTCATVATQRSWLARASAPR